MEEGKTARQGRQLDLLGGGLWGLEAKGSGVVGMEGEGVEVPPLIEGREEVAALAVEVDVAQVEVEAEALGFEDGFFLGPKIVEALGGGVVLELGVFFGAEEGLDVLDFEGAALFDVYANGAFVGDHADDQPVGMGNVEVELGVEEEFAVLVGVQLVEAVLGLLEMADEEVAQEDLAEEAVVLVLPAAKAQGLLLHGRGQLLQESLEDKRAKFFCDVGKCVDYHRLGLVKSGGDQRYTFHRQLPMKRNEGWFAVCCQSRSLLGKEVHCCARRSKIDFDEVIVLVQQERD